MNILKTINSKLRQRPQKLIDRFFGGVVLPIVGAIITAIISDCYKDCSKFIVIVSAVISLVVVLIVLSKTPPLGISLISGLFCVGLLFFPMSFKSINGSLSGGIEKKTTIQTESNPKKNMRNDLTYPTSEKRAGEHGAQQKREKNNVATASDVSQPSKIVQPENTSITGPHGWKPEMPKDLYPSGHAGYPVLENRPGPYGY